MQVNRITLDRELGLIHLETGPGGDGNYVLLPLPVPPTAEHLMAPMNEKDVVTEPEALTASGGYRVGPSDELVKAYAAELRVERGGIKYPNGPVPKPGYWQEVCVPEDKGVNIQAPLAEVPKSAESGCQCGAHRRKEFDGQLLGTPDPFPVLAFLRKAKFPTWYVTVPTVARLRINDVHTDSFHLVPDMVCAEIEKLTGRKVNPEKVHLVFPRGAAD